MEHVPQLVLENSVPLIDTADQVNIVVILVKVLLANVPQLVLESRVKRIPTAQVYIINSAVMENVPESVMVNLVSIMPSAHFI